MFEVQFLDGDEHDIGWYVVDHSGWIVDGPHISQEEAEYHLLEREYFLEGIV